MVRRFTLHRPWQSWIRGEAIAGDHRKTSQGSHPAIGSTRPCKLGLMILGCFSFCLFPTIKPASGLRCHHGLRSCHQTWDGFTVFHHVSPWSAESAHCFPPLRSCFVEPFGPAAAGRALHSAEGTTRGVWAAGAGNHRLVPRHSGSAGAETHEVHRAANDVETAAARGFGATKSETCLR